MSITGQNTPLVKLLRSGLFVINTQGILQLQDKTPNPKRLMKKPEAALSSSSATIQSKQIRREARREKTRQIQDALRDGFAGIVIIEDRDKAIAYASQEYESRQEKSRVTLWAHGSVRFGPKKRSSGAAAVVYKSDRRPFKWLEEAAI
jgi:hypothetical protein